MFLNNLEEVLVVHVSAFAEVVALKTDVLFRLFKLVAYEVHKSTVDHSTNRTLDVIGAVQVGLSDDHLKLLWVRDPSERNRSDSVEEFLSSCV
jgi:hypothetical protein